MSKKLNIIQLIISHIFPFFRGVCLSRNISFVSFRAKIKGNITLGEKSRIFPYVILNGDIKLGKHCSIHEFSYLSGNIQIGNYCRIASGVKIHAENHGTLKGILIHKQPTNRGSIQIGDDVWIGTNVVILKDVIIGDGAVIGAGSIVTKNVPKYEIWAGNPAKKISIRK